MAKFQLSDVEVGLSKVAETTINTPYLLTADFISALMNAQPPPIPQLRQIDDLDMIGDGNEWAEDLRPDYWEPAQASIGGKLNTEIAARFLARALGGTVTNTVVTAAASWDHGVVMQTRAQGRIPKLSTLFLNLGGSDFLWPSMAVNNFEISFEGVNDAQFAAALINTGYWRRLRDITPAILPPAPETHHYMHAAATQVTFNDGSVVDLASEGRLLGGRCGLNNNVVVRQLPGDPFITPGNRATGAYARDIHRGRRDGAASLKVSLDENLTEFVKLQSGTDITSLTYLFRGQKIGATAESFELEVKYPRCKLRVVTPDTDGDDVALTLDFFLRRDAVSGGLATGRVRNDQATLE